MTRYTPLWEQAGSYAASQDRMLLRAIFAGNTASNAGDYINGMRVSVASGMTVNVAPGTAVVHVVSPVGSIVCVSDAVEQVTLAPAPPSGQSRWDGIIAQARGNDFDGGSNNDFVMTVVQGTPAASNPAFPAVPSQAALLAWVNVPGGAASLVAANITEARVSRLSGLWEPPLAAADPFTSFTDPWGETWIAKGGVLNGTWKRARDVLSCYIYRSAAWSTPSAADIQVPFDSVLTGMDPFGMAASLNTNTARIIAPIAGNYLLTTSAGTGSGTMQLIRAWKNGVAGVSQSGQYMIGQPSGVTSTTVYAGSWIVKLAAGDDVSLWVRTSAAVALTVNSQITFLTATYLGTS